MYSHQQSHLYPCQLATIKIPSSNTQKFIFHCPINSYSTIYDPMTHDCDFLDHQQTRYSRISTIEVGEQQKYTLLSNSNSISLIGSQSAKIGHSIDLNPKQEIISDIISLPEGFTHYSLKYGDMKFSLAYLFTLGSKSEDNNFLTIQNFERINGQHQGQDYGMNPESEKRIKSEDSQQRLHSPSTDVLNQVSSMQLSIPSVRSGHFQPQNFQIKYNKINRNNRSWTFFQKKCSTVYTYDPQYQVFTNIIKCNQDEENNLTTEYQANKISFLSQNLIVNCHSNGLIKLIDQRMGRMAHMRNLVQEMTLFGQRPSLLRQQNSIKFWNQQTTTENSLSQTSQFLINLKNQIYQVNLRNNRIVKEDSVFCFDNQQSLTNFEITQSHNQRLYAFTTQTHSNYKAYIVQKAVNQ